LTDYCIDLIITLNANKNCVVKISLKLSYLCFVYLNLLYYIFKNILLTKPYDTLAKLYKSIWIRVFLKIKKRKHWALKWVWNSQDTNKREPSRPNFGPIFKPMTAWNWPNWFEERESLWLISCPARRSQSTIKTAIHSPQINSNAFI